MTRRVVATGTVVVLVMSAVAIVGYQLRFEALPTDVTADRAVIQKARRSLTLFRGAKKLKSYKIALGTVPVGPKEFEGDHKTPEGDYVIDWRKRDSGFRLALHVSYPSPDQVARAKSLGRSAGGQIMIHGIRNHLGFIGPLHRLFDWTDGCVAVTNAEIEELWRAVPDGTAVEIQP